MSGSLIRTLAALSLIFTATSSMAETSGYVMEHRWLTLFGEADYTLAALDDQGGLQQNVFESVLSRAFLTLDAVDPLAAPAATGRFFRDPDPAFGQPAAFRRHGQARLSFSIRF
jgi:hypothetical protein